MIEFDFFDFVFLPLMIFIARVSDVTLATVKLMFVVNNARKFAAILGFFEALITILALSRIMQDASNMAAYVMYAAGFAAGTYIGMRIEEKLAYGSVVIRIISKKIPDTLLIHLSENRYRYSMVDANDQSGNTQILFTVCKRSKVSTFLRNLENIAPEALYTIEGVKQVSHDLLPEHQKTSKPNLSRMLSSWGKRTQAAFYHW
ncbi:uncharacterized protein YebE (UPF0316 family) [Catalinimonas alkaloidigena]|uniref:DUF2179 domain-containing protein n=1 Tax=Catalinimonas alkaloidigena TaxID=1075417 RepID=UPI0024063364|nr:DUF5698 domain-containing protein [Catalinimonas alkaloidigena]MDF9796104.1 uncharacterized protein YebE (UPF0316 family) [Catalinimonas alkaloidigena]